MALCDVDFGVAIIGSGFGMREILPAISELPDIKLFLKAPSHFNSSIGSHFKGATLTLRTFEQILTDKSIKLIVLAVPPKVQKKFVEELSQSGKSIYLEKPAGLNSLETLEIKKLSSENAQRIYLGFQFRFDPGIRFLANEINTFGEGINNDFEIEVNWRIRQNEKVNSWKTNLREGGGLHRDYLCHVIDYIQNVLTNQDKNIFEMSHLNFDLHDNLNYVKLVSEKARITIERSPTFQTTWRIVYRDPTRTLELVADYPFTINDYSFSLNGIKRDLSAKVLRNSLPFPEISKRTQDARHIALQQNFMLVINEMKKIDGSSHPNIAIPDLQNAVSTQLISDQIQQTLTKS